MDELECWLVLSRAPGLSAAALSALPTELQSPQILCEASPAELALAGIPSAAIAAIHKPDDRQLALDVKWIASTGNTFVDCRSEKYPMLLGQIEDAPMGIFVRGNVDCISLPQLAIVGSRNPTAGGRQIAAAFASHLARCGLAITSGLATGIDAASHEGALAVQGITIAVCATGLDTVYPSEHRKLADAIAEHGALVSEFPPNTPAYKFNFPRRNRIISALSLGTLVVEAAVRSGSLITAKCAAEQGREVFAIPGSIHNPMSRGCHQLLRQGAKLVESSEDILAELGPLAAVIRGAATADFVGDATHFSSGPLDKDYKILLDALGFDPVSVDRLVERSGFKAEAVASMLLILELEGRIESLPGALYMRVAG